MTDLDKLGNIPVDNSAEDQNDSDSGFDVAFPAEILDSIPAENPSDNRSNAGSGASSSTELSADRLLKQREELIASSPPKDQLISDVKNALETELILLNKEKKVIERKGVKASHLFNDIVSKIRKINSDLMSIASMSYEKLKALWLKLVHNIY